MADAGLRLTVEGEKEFKAALAEIDAAVKNNQKSMKLLTEEFKLNETGMKDASSGFGSMADAADILATKGKVLADSIEMQTEKVNLLDLRVEEAAKAYGEHDKRTEALRAQLLDASTALAKMTTEQEKNRQAILDAENSTKEYDEAVKALDASLAANDAEMKDLNAQIGGLEKEYDSLGRSSDDLKKKTENLKAQNAALEKQNKTLNDSITKQRESADKMNSALELAVKRYGEGSKEAEAYRKKIADATGEINRMEAELKENAAAIEENNKKIEEGGESGEGLRDMLGKVSELTGVKIPAGLDKMVGGISGAAGAAGGIVTAFVALEKKIFDIYGQTLDWANDVSTKSAELDISTTEYQQLEFAAQKAKVEMSVFESALTKISQKCGDAELSQVKLNKQIEDQEKVVRQAWQEWNRLDQLVGDSTVLWDLYKDEWKAAKKNYEDSEKALSDLKDELENVNSYWDELGISLTDANGTAKTSLELLMELIDAYAELPEGIERAASMSEIFGRQYEHLLPLLEGGSEALREWMDEAIENGYVMDEATMATNDYAAAQKNVFDTMMDQSKRKAATAWADSGDAIAGSFAYATEMVKGFDAALKEVSGDGILDALSRPFKNIKNWFSELFGGRGSSDGGGGGHRYASGTNYASGGMALVGEQGPEIVELPRGSKVYPNGTTPQIGGTTVSEVNTYNVVIDAKSVEEFNDIVRIAQGARVGMRRG